VFTGSSGVGWFYAMEAIVVTAGLRLPVVAMVGNRALDDPGAFGVEHNDALAVRDLGWMLTWIDSAQEALDTALIAYKVAENPRVFLPCALGMDGAFLTHSQSIVKIPPKELVDRFLPPYDRGRLRLHPDNPVTIAPQVNEDWLMEIRRQTDQGMRNSREVLIDAYREFHTLFGRQGGNPFVEEYMTEGADIILVGQGTLAMPAKVAVRQLRAQGKKVGFLRLKWLRPFPTEEITSILSRAKAVGVIDRDYSFGSPSFGGVLFNEIRSAMYTAPKRPPMHCFIAGLGGREVSADNLVEMSDICHKTAQTGRVEQDTYWVGIRG
jgi:pyruvate ferredoxin oxidoreductase alpha subunit